jgi:hypothetical protein
LTGAVRSARRVFREFFASSVRAAPKCATFLDAPQDGKRGDPMAGNMTNLSLIVRAAADLLPGFEVFGGKVRMVGPDLCPTGH